MSNKARIANKRANDVEKRVEEFIEKDGAIIFNHQRLMEYRLSAIQEILLSFNPFELVLFILLPKRYKMKWADEVICAIGRADEKEQVEAMHDQRVAEMETAKRDRAKKLKDVHYKGFRPGHDPKQKSVVEIRSKDGQTVAVTPETNPVAGGMAKKLEALN